MQGGGGGGVGGRCVSRCIWYQAMSTVMNVEKERQEGNPCAVQRQWPWDSRPRLCDCNGCMRGQPVMMRCTRCDIQSGAVQRCRCRQRGRGTTSSMSRCGGDVRCLRRGAEVSTKVEQARGCTLSPSLLLKTKHAGSFETQHCHTHVPNYRTTQLIMATIYNVQPFRTTVTTHAASICCNQMQDPRFGVKYPARTLLVQDSVNNLALAT